MKNLWHLSFLVLFFLPACNCCKKKCTQPVLTQNSNSFKQSEQLALNDQQPHKENYTIQT